jgi:hypothetical protein
MVRWSLVGGADVSEEHNASVFWCHKPDVLHPFPHVETEGNKTRGLTRQETCRPTVRCSALNFQTFLSDFAHSTVLDIHLGMTNFIARPFFSEAFSTTLIQTSLFMYKSYYTAQRSIVLSRYYDSLRAGRSGDWIQVGATFSAPIQTGPGTYPASCTMGTVSFPGVKRPGRGVDHPPPSSTAKQNVMARKHRGTILTLCNSDIGMCRRKTNLRCCGTRRWLPLVRKIISKYNRY